MRKNVKARVGRCALGRLSNNIFTFEYVLCVPNKEQLIAEVERVIENWDKKDN